MLSTVYVCVYVYIQVHFKNLECHEKGQYFLSLISESVECRVLVQRIKSDECVR